MRAPALLVLLIVGCSSSREAPTPAPPPELPVGFDPTSHDQLEALFNAQFPSPDQPAVRSAIADLAVPTAMLAAQVWEPAKLKLELRMLLGWMQEADGPLRVRVFEAGAQSILVRTTTSYGLRLAMARAWKKHGQGQLVPGRWRSRQLDVLIAGDDEAIITEAERTLALVQRVKKRYKERFPEFWGDGPPRFGGREPIQYLSAAVSGDFDRTGGDLSRFCGDAHIQTVETWRNR